MDARQHLRQQAYGLRLIVGDKNGGDAQPRGQLPLFRRHADLFLRGKGAPIIKENLPAVRHLQPGDHAEQGRFAAA